MMTSRMACISGLVLFSLALAQTGSFVSTACAAQSSLAPMVSPVPAARPSITFDLMTSHQGDSALLRAQENKGAQTNITAGLTGLARLVGPGVVMKSHWRGIELEITMTRAVPWRVFTLDAPQRVVLDFAELDWGELDTQKLAGESDYISDLRAGLFRPGWTRMVLDLGRALEIESASMVAVATQGSTEQGGPVRMRLVLAQTSNANFSAKTGAPMSVQENIQTGAQTNSVFDATQAQDHSEPKTRQDGISDLVVVLDPGHGGIDPGAQRAGVIEADLMLEFAFELKESLLRAGGIHVVMTRQSDVFVPLEERVSIARRAGADVFLSLHADALAQGRATGATVYTLSEDASDAASQTLAERHDREDLLAGVDLSHQDDEVALVLMDMARTETAPRSEALAESLVEGIYSATGSSYKSPRLQAGFSVLKAPDIPSALIELGFLSSPKDRELLMDKAWRMQAADGIRDALLYWALQDATKAELLRK